VRHPRLVPFSAAAAGFGLETAYEPLSLLGRGGSGQVWLARERATGHLRALKLHQRPIPRASVRLAFNEVEVGAGVCASNVFLVHLVEAVLTPSHLALVLEYEAGGSLAELVARQVRVARG
jgi:serine/threonine protein kinase